MIFAWYLDIKKRSFLNSSFEAMERKNAHENISYISIQHYVEKIKRNFMTILDSCRKEEM